MSKQPCRHYDPLSAAGLPVKALKQNTTGTPASQSEKRSGDGQIADGAGSGMDYRRNLAILSFSRQTPTHLPILTQPALLSSGERRSPL